MPFEAIAESWDIADESTDDGSVGGSVFVGNTLLVIGLLFVIFALHIIVVSAVEAYWLTEVRSAAACNIT